MTRDRLHATAFTRGVSASEALRQMIDEYNEPEERWTV